MLGRDLAAAVRGDASGWEQALLGLLQSRGYEPFAAEPGIVRLRNCPFDDVAARHPELVCALNLALIEGMLAGLRSDPGNALLDPQEGACCVAIRAPACS